MLISSTSSKTSASSEGLEPSVQGLPPFEGTLIDNLTSIVEKAENPEQISLIDGQRCTHEWGISENGDASILCSVKTDTKCEACGEIYCPRHMHLHKRFYCMGVAR